jgi:hypothetical protein
VAHTIRGAVTYNASTENESLFYQLVVMQPVSALESIVSLGDFYSEAMVAEETDPLYNFTGVDPTAPSDAAFDAASWSGRNITWLPLDSAIEVFKCAASGFSSPQGGFRYARTVGRVDYVSLLMLTFYAAARTCAGRGCSCELRTTSGSAQTWLQAASSQPMHQEASLSKSPPFKPLRVCPWSKLNSLTATQRASLSRPLAW